MQKNRSRALRTIVPIILILMYLAGLFVMFFGLFSYGIALWVFSTVLALAFLYRVKAVDEAMEIIREQEEEKDHADEA